MHEVEIRKGIKSDLPQVLELIKELALYEKAPHEVTNTVELMERDGFGPQPIYSFFVADQGGVLKGISLYYWRYSTWKGKRLYLEDIIVTESERGTGIGRKLFERTMKEVIDADCNGMTWQVLDWNEPAIKFYQKYNPAFSSEWLNGALSREQIIQFFHS